jgi:predicted nuclease of predicted toxin-antitoxin system
VKLLFDENLSPRLPELLSDIYPHSAHVHDCGLGSADDTALWEYAKANSFTIVSKDSDFEERSVLLGSPPKIIWVRATNCTTKEAEALLRSAHQTVSRFIQVDEETCLILGSRHDSR